MYMYVQICIWGTKCVCVCVSVFDFYTLEVILMECVLIRTRQNVSTSLDKGLWRGEWAATIARGKEKDSERRGRHLAEKRERWGETARRRWSGGQYFLWHPVIQHYNESVAPSEHGSISWRVGLAVSHNASLSFGIPDFFPTIWLII